VPKPSAAPRPEFLTKSHKAKTCGYQCREVLRTRPSNVVYLTAEVFDGWFRKEAA
jgi:hypothetical protein